MLDLELQNALLKSELNLKRILRARIHFFRTFCQLELKVQKSDDNRSDQNFPSLPPPPLSKILTKIGKNTFLQSLVGIYCQHFIKVMRCKFDKLNAANALVDFTTAD